MEAEQGGRGDEEEEPAAVLLADAVVEPRAVVLVARDAAVADAAVVRAGGPGGESARADLSCRHVRHLRRTKRSLSKGYFLR